MAVAVIEASQNSRSASNTDVERFVIEVVLGGAGDLVGFEGRAVGKAFFAITFHPGVEVAMVGKIDSSKFSAGHLLSPWDDSDTSWIFGPDRL